MRKKELKLVITFHTTADAMAMEKLCRQKSIPGRLIPVPRILSAGCGLSWNPGRSNPGVHGINLHCIKGDLRGAAGDAMVFSDAL